MPDYCFDDIYAITPEFLVSLGVKLVLLDIDNTLVPYEEPLPTAPVLKWLAGLDEKGIAAAFISNNERERVETFNRGLQYYASWKSKKPSVRYYRKAMEKNGVGREGTAVIGDQIFTDVWSAKRLGVPALLVKPIRDKKTLLFRFKRALEKPILRRFRRREEKETARRKEGKKL